MHIWQKSNAHDQPRCWRFRLKLPLLVGKQGFAFAEPAKSAEDETQEKRGEKGQPTAERFDDVEVGKHSNTDGPEKYDQGHIEATPTQGMGHHDRKSYMMSSPTYTKEYVESVTPRHKKPEQVQVAWSLQQAAVSQYIADSMVSIVPADWLLLCCDRSSSRPLGCMP